MDVLIPRSSTAQQLNSSTLWHSCCHLPTNTWEYPQTRKTVRLSLAGIMARKNSRSHQAATVAMVLQTHLPGHSEIAQLAMPVPIEQKIAALDVPVDELLAVQIFKSLCPLCWNGRLIACVHPCSDKMSTMNTTQGVHTAIRTASLNTASDLIYTCASSVLVASSVAIRAFTCVHHRHKAARAGDKASGSQRRDACGMAAALTSLAIWIRNLHPSGVCPRRSSFSRSPPCAYSVMM